MAERAETIWNDATDILTPCQGPDTMLNWIMLFNSTVGKCTTMQVVKQPEHGRASTTKEQKCPSFQANYGELITPRGLQTRVSQYHYVIYPTQVT